MGVADAAQTASTSAAAVTVASGKPTASMAKQGGCAVLEGPSMWRSSSTSELGGGARFAH
jgi:hypothetical protein